MINKISQNQSNRTLLVLIFFVSIILSAWSYANLSYTASIGVLGISAMVVLVLYKIKNLFIFIILLKPVIDLSWDAQFFSLGGSSINLLKLVGIFIPSVCIVQLIITPRLFKLTKSNLWVIVFLITNMMSTITVIFESNDILGSVVNDTIYWFKLSNGLLIFLTLPYVFDLKHDYLYLIRLFFYSTIAPTVVSITLIITNSFNVTMGQNVSRFAGIYHDAGGLSLNAFIGITISLLYWVLIGKYNYTQKRETAHRILIIFILLTNLLMMYWSITRMMYLVTFIFISGWFFFQYRLRWSLLVILPIAIGYIWTDESFQRRNWKEIKAYEEYQKGGNYEKYVRVSGGGRIDRWDDILERIGTMHAFEWIHGTGKGSSAHNEYLDTFIRTGLLGLVSLLMATGYLFFLTINKTTHKSTAAEVKSVTTFAALLITSLWLMSLTGYTISQTTLGIFIWSILSIAVYAQPIKQEQAHT